MAWACHCAEGQSGGSRCEEAVTRPSGRACVPRAPEGAAEELSKARTPAASQERGIHCGTSSGRCSSALLSSSQSHTDRRQCGPLPVPKQAAHVLMRTGRGGSTERVGDQTLQTRGSMQQLPAGGSVAPGSTVMTLVTGARCPG